MKNLLGVVVVVLLLLTPVANAGLMLDLTAEGGSKTIVPLGTSGSFTLQLWGIVYGTDGNVYNEGIQSAYAWIKTTSHGITGLTGITSQPNRASTMGTAVNDGTLSGGDLVGSTKATTWCAKTSAGTNTPPMTSLGGATVPATGEYKILDANTVAYLLGNIFYNYSNLSVSDEGGFEINAVVPTWASSLNLAAVYGQDYAGTFQKVTSASQVSVGAPVSFHTIPEPASLVLLGMGALALVFVRRRKWLH